MTAVSAVATDYASWRESARALLAASVPPEAVSWHEESAPSLFDAPPAAPATGRIAIPRALAALLEAAACHAEPERWGFMYRLLWRVVRGGGRALAEDPADGDVVRVRSMARAVDHEVHRMHAFVRFRERATDEGPLYEAWFEPGHDVLRRGAPFFVERFASMRWIIATPRGAAAWDGKSLAFIDAPVAKREGEDAGEALWRTYYASIFNPARVNPALMRQHMPRRYWANLPEAREITRLTRAAAPSNEPAKAPRWSAQVHVPLAPLDALQACRRCPLWEHATQAVAGRGPRPASLMLVGEQPGDEEDLRGEPFVGPAGEVLGRALEGAGIARGALFLTNAVKHFKWEPRGKRRLHKTPAQREIEACMAWLERDLDHAAPRVIVALGATALFALLGERMAVGAARARDLAHARGIPVVATYHPSAVLRAGENGGEIFEALRADLARAWRLAEG